MPKDQQISAAGHHQVRTLLEFSISLQKQLSSAQSPITTRTLLSSVGENSQVAAQLPQRSQIKRLFGHDLSTAARSLWNLCVRLPPVEDLNTELLRLRCRQFAFSLMHLAKWPSTSGIGTNFTELLVLLTMLFKTCQVAMNMDELEAAADAMTKAAHCVALLPETKDALDAEQMQECQQLEVRNLCLRTALAWREGRLEVAEAMHARTEPLKRSLDPEAAEEFAEVLYEIGSGLAKKGVYEGAVSWLSRAMEVLDGQDVEMLTRDAGHLRDTVHQALVTALLETGKEEDWNLATKLVDRLGEAMGEQPINLALRLEVLGKAFNGRFDPKEYGDIVLRLVRMLAETPKHLGLIQHHIDILHSKDPTVGCKVMDQWLLRFAEPGSGEGFDSAILQRVAMAARQQGVAQTIFDLLKLLDALHGRGLPPIEGSTAFSAQALVWKKMDDLLVSTENSINVAEGWCQVACHPVFENAGPANISILRRKLIQSALDAGDADIAQRTLQAMSPEAQDEPLTQYLVFKLAMAISDQQLALKSLSLIARATQEPDLLYACAMQAQAHADKVMACHTLLALVDNLDATDKACSPALLRSALRLLGHQLKEHSQTEEKNQIATQTCAVLSRAAEEIERSPLDDEGCPLYNVPELEYFSKTCLNLVVKHRETLDLAHIVQISQVCIDVNRHYPHGITDAQAGDACLRSMWCHFMAACAMVALARCEKDREKRYQTYQNLRHHVAAYDESMQGRAESFEEPLKQDLRGKFAHLLLFDLEAAVHLLDYDALQGIIRKAVLCKDGEVMKAMADCLLRGEVKPEYLYPAMKEAINGLWDIHEFEFSSLAKFVRCLFQALLPVHAGMCEELLGIAVEMAREPTDVDVSFPREEVEWLIVKAWNQACDFRSGGRGAEFDRWAELASTLARYVPDEGRMEAQVRGAWDIIKEQEGSAVAE